MKVDIPLNKETRLNITIHWYFLLCSNSSRYSFSLPFASFSNLVYLLLLSSFPYTLPPFPPSFLSSVYFFLSTSILPSFSSFPLSFYTFSICFLSVSLSLILFSFPPSFRTLFHLSQIWFQWLLSLILNQVKLSRKKTRKILQESCNQNK